MYTKFLDQGLTADGLDAVKDAFDLSGYTPEEIIPGLVAAIHYYAGLSMAPEECLDEAANLLAEGPSEDS